MTINNSGVDLNDFHAFNPGLADAAKRAGLTLTPSDFRAGNGSSFSLSDACGGIVGYVITGGLTVESLDPLFCTIGSFARNGHGAAQAVAVFQAVQ